MSKYHTTHVVFKCETCHPVRCKLCCDTDMNRRETNNRKQSTQATIFFSRRIILISLCFRDVLWLLCWEDPSHRECREIISDDTNTASVGKNCLSVPSTLVMLTGIFIIVHISQTTPWHQSVLVLIEWPILNHRHHGFHNYHHPIVMVLLLQPSSWLLWPSPSLLHWIFMQNGWHVLCHIGIARICVEIKDLQKKLLVFS